MTDLSEEPSKNNIDTKNNIFTLYAKISQCLLTMPKFLYDERYYNRELEQLILPSNEEWRYRVYYRLVELQRQKDMIKSKHRTIRQKSQDWEWHPRKEGYLLKEKIDNANCSETAASMTEVCVKTTWRINDIILAAKILQNIQPSPTYTNEAEMRRVFALVYDVLKYKNILNHILEDGRFWYQNIALKQRERIVWLLLYDMQRRKFSPRHNDDDDDILKTWETAFIELKDIEDALFKARTRLAASVSRLRIAGSALNLDQLLPMHLRVAEGINWSDATIASGWVNSIKVGSKEEFLKNMSKLKFKLYDGNSNIVDFNEDCYVFDPICPKLINLHDNTREKLAVSDLVRNHQFVFLERSLCFGAATLAQAIRIMHLCGPVVLTHSIAPRHTGYLAGLLADIDHVDKLLVFGAGDRRCEYQTYLTTLGITLQQCEIYSDKYTSPPPSLLELERATVVLATPPCSYTGVKNIVDLVVARGGARGDTTDLLESLTDDTANQIKHTRAFLADQFSTLKYALTRPNIQLLIYQVHTILPSETTEMIRQVVEYANQIAMEKYISKHPPKGQTLSSSEKKMNQQEQTENQKFSCNQDGQSETSIDVTDITIPDSDLFQLASIDEIYGTMDNRQMLDPSCFLAVIKRKEIIQFDSLFMIKVAESKGLFADPEQNPKQKSIILPPARHESRINRKAYSKRIKIELDRVAAPTHSSILRTTNEHQLCPRHKRYIGRDKNPPPITQKRDTSANWKDAITFFFRSRRCDSVSEFRTSHSFTRKLLYPFHVKKITLSKR